MLMLYILVGFIDIFHRLFDCFIAYTSLLSYYI